MKFEMTATAPPKLSEKHWLTAFLEDLFCTLVLFYCPACNSFAGHTLTCLYEYQLTLIENYNAPEPTIIWTDDGTITVPPADSFVTSSSEFEIELKRED